MGKKGAKRKTRWRTLSIGSSPDKEDVLHNSYVRTQENRSFPRNFERSSQLGFKPKQLNSGTPTSATSGYVSSPRSCRDDPFDSPTQQKIIFNENEYTRITTPRQDMLFKKGYLAQKKPSASTSATPSTTESQSASHSTADGSETTEDQQLIDCSTGEFNPIVEPIPQLSYGTFYDQTSGYYYEYPVMLVPPPMQEQLGANILTTTPCGHVPLRPIEWVNPAFVPKVATQQYCVMDYQTSQSTDCASLVDVQNESLTIEEMNIVDNEGNCSGSTSSNSSIAEEEPLEDIIDKPPDNLENYVETLPPQPLHVSHVTPQPYLYPGHYMFGPLIVNVNGFTIQSGPIIRCNGAVATTAACAKRRRKKKKRKLKKQPLGNTEDEDEDEYSSEGDNGLSNSRVSWPANSTVSSQPLNPDCQEFQPRSNVELQPTEQMNGALDNNVEDKSVVISSFYEIPGRSNDLSKDCDIEAKRLNELSEATFKNETKDAKNNSSHEFEDENPTSKTNGTSAKHKRTNPLPTDTEDTTLINNLDSLGIDRTKSENREASTHIPQRRKYKASKVNREPTPGPDLCVSTIKESEKAADGVDSINPEAAFKPKENGLLKESNQVTKNDIHNESCEIPNVEHQPQVIDRPISEAVNEWLQRAYSPDLFVASPTTSEESEEDEVTEIIEPSKNLHGNPMPALSANGYATKRIASDGEFARNDYNENSSIDTNHIKMLGEEDDSGLDRRKSSTGNSDDAQHTNLGTLDVKNPVVQNVVDFSEFTEEDSDADMRVALLNSRKRSASPVEPCGRHQALLKTYERGEIIVSMDGKFLRTVDQDLSSIEELDVLECWEAEIIQPVAPRRRKIDKEVSDSVALAIKTPDGVSESVCVDETLVITETKNKRAVDEAFEVYESCYGSKLRNSKLRLDNEVTAVPCRVVCCNIQ